MGGRLLQEEHVHHDPVQNVVGSCKKLVESPAFLLIHLQDIRQDGDQLVLQAPAAAMQEEMFAQTGATSSHKRGDCRATESHCPALHPFSWLESKDLV